VANLNDPIPLSDNLANNVFMFNSLYLIKEPLELLKEIRRILKPGGRAFITFQFIKSEETCVIDLHRFTSFQVKKILNEAGFTQVQINSVGERFSVIGDLADFAVGNFFMFRFLKILFRPFCLLADKVWPKKLKENYPCAIAWFAVVEK
jgi:ubiquinone/menaquinone biosynthesis C-methylase UbiE